jgi:ATP-dependent RNA helicase HelY
VRSRRAAASSWPRRPAPARPSWASSPSTSRWCAGRKAFYTTPIKALSNQKYADLVRVHGPAAVGLLTGDNSVNADAPVVVMTTEVLRNMLYADSPALAGLGYVVMDEVHYLADRFRGAVWEEVIIHLPDDVLVASLSATVSNAEEFGAWLDTVRGNTEVVVSEHRPVPLWQHVLVGPRLYDLFTDDHVNTDLVRMARDQARRERMARGGNGPRPPAPPGPRAPRAAARAAPR